LNYEQTVDGYTVGKFIPVSQVLEYSKHAVRQQTTNEPDKILYSYPDVKRWQFGVRFGGAYILPSVNSDELTNIGIPEADTKDYLKKLRHGLHFGAKIHYIFYHSPAGELGIGGKYRLSSFASRLETVIPQGYVYYPFAINENTYVNYYGLSLIMQNWLSNKRKFKLAADISAGYAHYRSEARFDETSILGTNNLLATGQTFAVNAELSLSYHPLKYLSANVSAGYFSAIFKRLTIADKQQSSTVDLDSNNYENVSQLNYSIGIQLHF
jgi:hypothetical protein